MVFWFSERCKNINSESSKSELQKQATGVYQVCVRSNIELNILWIPHTENEQADFISKPVDNDDWGVTDEFLNYMNRL